MKNKNLTEVTLPKLIADTIKFYNSNTTKGKDKPVSENDAKKLVSEAEKITSPGKSKLLRSIFN